MKRYLVTVYEFDGSEYTVDDRLTGKHYGIGAEQIAFKMRFK